MTDSPDINVNDHIDSVSSGKDDGLENGDGTSLENGKLNGHDSKVTFSVDEEDEERDEMSETSINLPRTIDSLKFRRQQKQIR